jgi:hypothetical protein
MSSSAISALGGIDSAALNPIFAAIQAAAKPPASTAPAAAAPTSGAAQPILLIPTKPPLSAAVMAVLLGRQSSSDGASVGGHAGDQRPVDGGRTTGNNNPVAPLG